MDKKTFLPALLDLISDYWPRDGERKWARWLIPTPGNVAFTVIIVFSLFWAQSAGALPLPAYLATSTSTVSYQGRLADSGGTPLTGFYNLEFRIYDVPTGGIPLWQELWTGGNAVEVSDGLFNVMLGSIDNTLAASIDGYDELYLGITVGTDGEMAPRVQLGSVPFSMQAMTVPDAAISRDKLANGALPYTLYASDSSMITINAGETATLLSQTYADIPSGDIYLTVRLAVKHTQGGKLGSASLWINGTQKGAVPFHGVTTGQWQIFTFSDVVQDFEGGVLIIEIQGGSEPSGGSFTFGTSDGDRRFNRILTAIVGLD